MGPARPWAVGRGSHGVGTFKPRMTTRVAAGDTWVKSIPSRGARKLKGPGVGTALTRFGEGEKADGGWSILSSGVTFRMRLQKQAEVMSFEPQGHGGRVEFGPSTMRRHGGVPAHESCSF